MSEAKIKFCATCGKGLNHITDEAGTDIYFHIGGTDHTAAPVSAEELGMSQIVPICDFCSALTNAQDVHTFECPDLRNPALGAQSLGPWAACPECRDLVLAGDQGALLQRSLTHYFGNRGVELGAVPTEAREGASNSLGSLHRAFFEARSDGEHEDYPGLPKGLIQSE